MVFAGLVGGGGATGCGDDSASTGEASATETSLATDSTTATSDTATETTTDGETTTTSTTGEVDAAPEAPVLELGFSQVKQLDFTWTPAFGAQYYRLLERNPGDAEYLPVGDDLAGISTSLTVPVLLHQRLGSAYIVEACNSWGCTPSAAVEVVGSLVGAIGYIKASSTDEYNRFGASVALSADGSTLAVGANAGAVYVFVRDELDVWTEQAYVKASNEAARFGESVALSADGSTLAVGSYGVSQTGAVYVFVRDHLDTWTEEAFILGSNTEAKDYFGNCVALSGDGNTLAAGAPGEASSATGINSDQADNSASRAGAAYVFTRDNGLWTQRSYIKASNTDEGDEFGWSVALSGDGGTLAVGAWIETGNATGINGDQGDNSADKAGAVYVFARDGLDAWTQQAYVKASNANAFDYFGVSVALNSDGDTLAVGAYWEASSATGIDGNQADNLSGRAGAVYMFVRDHLEVWTQQAYIKASNTDFYDYFGSSVDLSGDGNTLAVGAWGEASNATGIGGFQGNGPVSAEVGAVYAFFRDDLGVWTQEAYMKASNAGSQDLFGGSVALSADGSTLAVGSYGEMSNATGIGGNQADNSSPGAGAVYLY